MTTKSSFQLLRSAHHNSALRQSQDHLKACETFIGYTFTDIGLLSEALQAPGSMCLGANGQLLKRGNENLAIVGDAALTAILSAEWFRTDTNTQKGEETLITSMRLFLRANVNAVQATGNNNGATACSATRTSPASAESPD